MNKIRYEQIICASSQKSITTGSPGFGVRSKSAGISDIEADELFIKSGINYRLPIDMMATEETIMSNPNVEEDFPSLYTYKSVQLNNGEKRYIIAKTLYIGLDYGYFANLEGARRAGSNYIAHILVFKKCPSVSVISFAIENNLFLPHNTICTPDNEELCSYLVGEPTPLSDGEINFEKGACIQEIDTAYGWFVISLLQYFKNSKDSSPNIRRNIIFKVNHQKIVDLLISLGTLPEELTKNLYFQANTRLLSSVPDGLNMLLLNEKEENPTDDDYHITIDLLGNEVKTYNVEENYLFDKILKCCQENDADTLSKIIQLFLRLRFDSEIDYPFVYKLMILASTPKELTIDQITPETLEKILSYPLGSKDESVVWTKVNNTINDVFAVGHKASEVKTALENVSYLKIKSPQRLSLRSESCNFVIDLLFNRCERFVGILENSSERLDGAIYMIDNADKFIPDPISFYNALETSTIPEQWEKFLKLYYKDDIRKNMGIIIGKIMNSNVSSKESLMSKLFPVDDYISDWIDLINGNHSVVDVFGGHIMEYFTQQVSSRTNEGIKRFLTINKSVRDSMDNNIIATAYLNSIEHNQKELDEGLLVETRDSLNIDTQTKERFSLLVSILNEAQLSYVDTKIVNLACKISKNKEYLFGLFEIWMKSIPSAKDTANFAESLCVDAKDACRIFESIWKNLPEKKRGNFILQVTDEMSWRRYSLDRVTDLLHDKELRNVLVQENTFFKKIVRKGTSTIFGLFTGSKK
jgi:hypothetical protein